MPTLTGNYEIREDSAVSVSVVIGDAQPGGSSVFLGPNEVASGDVTGILLGSGGSLRRKVLVVNTTVVDQRQETDWTSVTVVLTGGGNMHQYQQSELAETGGTVNYLTVITFV